MKTNYEIRYAAHPEYAKSYDTTRIRRDFLIEKIFVPNEVNMVYSMYDRMVVGGALPVGEVLTLEAIDPLKAPFFLTRREMGIYNLINVHHTLILPTNMFLSSEETHAYLSYKFFLFPHQSPALIRHQTLSD